MTRFLSAIGALFLIAGLSIAPASADGVLSKGRIANDTHAASGPSFKTGCWVGVRADTTSSSLAVFTVNDAMLGVGGGCDYVIPGSSILVGAMGDISTPYGSLSDLGVDYQWFVGARAGALVSDRLLAYALVGYTSLDGGIPSLGGAIDTTGLTFGAGAELLLTQNITAGVEWRRVDLGTDIGPLVATQDSFGAFLRYRF